MSDPAVHPAFVTAGPYHVIRNFLGPTANQRLLDYVAANEGRFVESTVYDRAGADVVNRNFRISSWLRPAPQIHQMLQTAYEGVKAELFTALSHKPREIREYEIEIAAHNDGAFFKTHVDTVTGRQRPELARLISGVYYFFREPAGFSGGEFTLRSIAPVEAGGAEVVIPPENDMLLAFPSSLPHEVRPVSCPSGQFMDSRFAVNCWFMG